MDCPECGHRLTDYHLGDRGAVGCENCGYVGIDAEHRGRPTERESWDDALERFHRRHGDEGCAADAAPTPDDRADETPDAVADRSADDARPERPAAVNGSLGSESTDGADEG
jgi:transcription initiation factor TFIIIB Brf1 subunit/transcription initiation factor TFIIB